MSKKLQLLFLLVLLSQTNLPAQLSKLQRKPFSFVDISRNTTVDLSQNNAGQKVLSACSDKVNYVGSTYGTAEKCGGIDITSPYVFFQVYPDFNGSVTRVDVRAAKIATNVNAQVLIYAIDVNNGNAPTGMPIGTANVNINGGWAEYGANFAPAITVSGGFAAAVFAPLLTDSFMVACSPDFSQTFGDNAFALDDFNGLYTFWDYKDFIIRPTISFTMPTLNLTATPNSTCTGTSVDFVGGVSGYPNFFNNSMYNNLSTTPGFYINYGDGSPAMGSNPTYHTQHSYATVGTKVASYNLEFTGWNSTCTETVTQNVNVNPGAVSSFSYGTTDLLLTVVNNSSYATSYSWNFGDLTTSTLQNPPVHDYGLTQGAGTYVVELTTVNTCGNGYQATTITVAPGTSTGLNNTTFDENIFVYPNPASSNVTVDYELLKNQERIQLFIADASGKILKTESINDVHKGTVNFDIKDLAPGTYFIKLSSDKRNAVRTFVKQ